MTTNQSFEVFLTDEASEEFGDSSIRAESVDFYDSGVWLTHADGRDFFPYRRVLRISEGATTTDPATEGGREGSVAERRDAASGTAGAADDTELDVT
ncbi:hypothetical protein [Haloplanus pelagicus]|jgi:hypothetical protein|uniref:hypothetical protein n=1 Tax=Haloplanus pelagicus TaxID=2949995 RepID=UPI00203CF734|nr:hypothetical protein [Haloplanus sp. HW8-1]